MNAETEIGAGYAESRTETCLNQKDHVGMRKADAHPFLVLTVEPRFPMLATPPVVAGHSVGNYAILYSAYPHKNDLLLLISAVP